MAGLPKSVTIHEEGPREGFQFEKGNIPTARKIELIDALSATGLTHIQIVSFVNPKAVPGMADADEVVAGFHPKEGVHYTALWMNERGFERAQESGRIYIRGGMSLTASESFLMRNQKTTMEDDLAYCRRRVARFKELGIPVTRAFVMAAFGCNFEGDIDPKKVVGLVQNMLDIAEEQGSDLDEVTLGDTMGWATPIAVKRLVGMMQDRYPSVNVALHLHDTRGMGISNAFAGLEMGVEKFDSSIAGLGGCPFAGHAGAAGNVCTEDLVFMCQEMGIETGLDLEKLIACAQLAEDVVGHSLPGSVMRGGSLNALRRKVAAARAA